MMSEYCILYIKIDVMDLGMTLDKAERAAFVDISFQYFLHIFMLVDVAFSASTKCLPNYTFFIGNMSIRNMSLTLGKN